jgi:hypothetical protein
MEPLISGLSQSLSIALLSFRNDHFDHEASDLFVAYMETPKSTAHSLCSLDMQSSFASLIAIPLHLKKSPGPTIGSSLQSLEIKDLDDVEFFPTLDGSAANILITSLQFGRLRRSDASHAHPAVDSCAETSSWHGRSASYGSRRLLATGDGSPYRKWTQK